MLLPATRGLWNSLEDFKLQVMLIIMMTMVTIMIMMGLVEQLGGLQTAGGNDDLDHCEDHGDHHDYDGPCGIAFGGFQVAGDANHHDDQDRWSS